MKRCIRKIVSVVLAATLCLAMGSVAFAEDGQQPAQTETNATAYITKELQMPIGTNTPNATFKFNVTKVSVDGLTTDEAKATMPAAVASGDVEIAIDSSDATATSGDVKKVVDSTQIFANANWPHAGIYVYTITEQSSTYTLQTGETVGYSGASYTATVYVANKADGTGVYVKHINVTKDKMDDGSNNTATTDADKKVTPDQPDSQDPGDTSKGGLRFVNTFVKKIDVTPVTPTPDPDEPGKTDDNDNGLAVRKIVTGNLGDKTKDFSFTVKVTAPSLVNVTTYNAVIKSSDGKTADQTVKFASGEAKTITLKHGQELVFTDLYVGSAFEVQEVNLDSKYTATTYSVLNSATDPTIQSGAVQITGNVSEGKDLVSVDNKYNIDNPPTGILVNNLPFIMMIAVAAFGFAAYITIRRRRAML